jgi:hypothetical protein
MAKSWYDLMQSGKGGDAMISIVTAFGQGKFPKEIMYNPGTPGYHATWLGIVKAAEDANQPGKFTAFIGYEWTSLVAGNNLHRNVIFRDNADKATQVEPFTNYPPAVPIRATCGNGCRPTRTRPAARCWRSRTTATSATA